MASVCVLSLSFGSKAQDDLALLSLPSINLPQPVEGVDTEVFVIHAFDFNDKGIL